jgi:hypothetical protein
VYARYALPIMVTETSARGNLAIRGRWMDETIAAIAALRTQGVPIVGYTWFPLITMVDWMYRRGRRPLSYYLLHLGLYDAAFDEAGVLCRHRTSLVVRYQEHMARAMLVIGEEAPTVPSNERLPIDHVELYFSHSYERNQSQL